MFENFVNRMFKPNGLHATSLPQSWGEKQGPTDRLVVLSECQWWVNLQGSRPNCVKRKTAQAEFADRKWAASGGINVPVNRKKQQSLEGPLLGTLRGRAVPRTE